ncbi:hypothetical protein EDD17DRAFT_1635233 [Pisolithus thermaeus]|nr:hypothetical protein EDD17DRAFT_1635233 [Pisolithus thermaeus]
MQPSRCCISFIALVLLKTGMVHHPPGPNGEMPVTIDYNQVGFGFLNSVWLVPLDRCSMFDCGPLILDDVTSLYP